MRTGATSNAPFFFALMGLVVFAPLPFASQRPWAWTVLATSAGVLACSWAIMSLMNSTKSRSPVPVPRTALILWLLVALWAMLQASDWTPLSWHHPLWSERLAGGLPANVVADGGLGAVSLDPQRTWTGVLRLTLFATVFWLAIHLCRDRARARLALVIVAVMSMVYAVYGLAVHFSGAETVLWVDKVAYKGDLTATFINRNAYGAFAGLGLLTCIALFASGARARVGWHRYERAESLFTRAMPFLGGAMILGTALLLSHSRAAFAATVLAIGVLVVALVAGGVFKRRLAVTVMIVLLVVGIGVFMISGEGTLNRFLFAVEESEERANLYALVVTAIGDAPWTGFGLGAFEPAFHLYRDESLIRSVLFDFAHGVEMELIMDLGFPGAILYFAAITIPLLTCMKGLKRRRRDQIYPAVALAAATLLAVHGLVDFSAQMPATAMLFALLLGIGYSQSFNSERRKKRRESDALEEEVETVARGS